jgi:hypothetical protein
VRAWRLDPVFEIDKKSITEIGKPRQTATALPATAIRSIPVSIRGINRILVLSWLAVGNHRSEYCAGNYRSHQVATLDYDNRAPMIMMPAVAPAILVAIAPVVATGIAETIRIAGVPFPMFELTALEFPVILLLFPAPLVLVVFGAPITVGLVPIGGQGLACAG